MNVHPQIVVAYRDGPESGFLLRQGEWYWFELLAAEPTRHHVDDRHYLAKRMPVATHARLETLAGLGPPAAAGLEVPDGLLIAALHAPAVAVFATSGGMETSWIPVHEAFKVNALFFGFAQAATRVVEHMVRKEMDQIAAHLDPERLPIEEFKAELASCEAALGPLRPLPPGSIKPDDITKCADQADGWSVWVDLWHERGQSDWTLMLRFVEENSRMKLIIEQLHVM